MNESNLSDDALVELLTLTMEVNEDGSTIYRNHLGQVHRIHGPAFLGDNGGKWWFLNGKCHRTDGPAVIWPDGRKHWYLNGEYLTEQAYNERIRSL